MLIKVKVWNVKLTLNAFGNLLIQHHCYLTLMVSKLPSPVYVKNRLLLLSIACFIGSGLNNIFH